MVSKSKCALPPHAAGIANDESIFDQLENCQHTLPEYIAISSKPVQLHSSGSTREKEEWNSEALRVA